MPNQHVDYPITDWQYEVANGDTILGYEEWLDHKLADVRYFSDLLMSDDVPDPADPGFCAAPHEKRNQQ